MKRNLRVFLPVFCLAGAMLAEEAPVAVVRTSVPAGAVVDVSVPVEPDAGTGLGDLFPDGLPAAENLDGAVRVLQWDAERSRFDSRWCVDDVWLDEEEQFATGFSVHSGCALRLANPTECAFTFAVPGRIAASSASTVFAPGAHFAAYPYPFPVQAPPDSLLTAAPGLDAAASPDIFATWNARLSEYRLYGDGNTNDWPLAAGSAFWFINLRTNDVVWPVARPFSGAFTSPPSLPGFRSISLLSGTTARLAVETSSEGAADIVLRDNPASGEFSRPGWQPFARIARSGYLDDDTLPALPDDAAESQVRIYRIGGPLDTDADGLSDFLERLVHGTDPLLSDTDGDGVDDLQELLSGTDPLTADTIGVFTEGFEPPLVQPGPLSGQNGWTVDRSAWALVDTAAPLFGSASLRFRHDLYHPDLRTTAAHAVTSPAEADVLWADAWLDVGTGVAGVETENTIAAVFGADGRLCIPQADADGVYRWTPLPAAPVQTEGDMARLTMRLDYGARTWTLFQNGIRVSNALPMPSTAVHPTRLVLAGNGGSVDGIAFGTVRPEGLSMDDDALPDEWELRHFGSLASGADDDPDADGLSNADEFALGTDPMRADSDGDGIPDGWEHLRGGDPLSPDNAAMDADGDGRDTLREYLDGSDPDAPDLPPAIRAGGLRAFLYHLAESPDALPDFAPLAADAAAVLPVLSYTASTGGWTGLEDFTMDFALTAWGYLDVPESGTYALRLTSDDGSRLRLDGATLIDHDGAHASCSKTATAELARGLHPLSVDYFNRTGEAALVLEWLPPGADAWEEVPASRLCHRSDENLVPFVEVAIPGHPVVVGQDVLLSAEAWDFDGIISRVEFQIGTNAPLSVAESPYETHWIPADSGSIPVRITVFDDCGAASAVLLRECDVWPLASGYALGVEADYFALASNPHAIPSLEGATAAVSRVEAIVDHPSSATAWEGLPEDLYACFASVFSGFLWVPETGRYTLHLLSDDGSRLLLDGVEVLDHDGDHGATEVSAERLLSRGFHPLRIEHFNGRSAAALVFSWTPPGNDKIVVPERCLYHLVGNPDADGDGMPDWWERECWLDPSDPADAILDSDADGLTNLAEFLAGTDPHLIDTDNDGIPDAWEVANGTCPFLDDALGDLDGDGLSNLEEMRHGTAPDSADTDGDGIPDGVEVLNAHSDPLDDDFVQGNPVDLGGRTPGAEFSSSTGTWRTDEDGSAYAVERSGSLTWTLAVPVGGADALAVGIGQRNAFSRTATFDLSLYVDGLFVARQVVSAPYGTKEDAIFFLPEITPGEHGFRLVWHNWAVNTFLVVHDLRFVTFGGPDGDGDGVPDWKNHRAAESTSLDSLPLESLVSPLCVEGHDLWRDILEIEVATLETNQVYSTIKTIGDGFYVDIPLPTNGSAVVAMRDRSLSDAFQVEWSSLDVFAGEFATNALAIRTGDSLKIAPFDDEESDVKICRAAGGSWFPVTNWTETAATPYRFDSAGLYLVSVTHGGLLSDDTAYALVDVVRSRFPKRNPAILMDAPQTLECPALSPRNLLEHDSGLQVSAEIAGGGVALSLLTHESRDLGLVSRLEEDGAISDAVQVTPIWADNGSYFRILDNYGDGSQLVEVSLLLGAIPEGTTVTLSIFVSGVTFEDGTRTMTLTAADFDDAGHVPIRFIRARGVTTSVCHATAIYQDGKLLYSNR